MLFSFTTELFRYPGMAAWYFLSVPKKEAEEIKLRFGKQAKGWGSLKVLATVGMTSWNTSIFPDKKSGTYLLPVKKDIRKKEHISLGEDIKISLEILV